MSILRRYDSAIEPTDVRIDATRYEELRTAEVLLGMFDNPMVDVEKILDGRSRYFKVVVDGHPVAHGFTRREALTRAAQYLGQIDADERVVNE